MRTRPTEPQLMLAIILFVVFAFLMQGRAHGAGPYKVEVSTAEYLEGTVYWFDVGPFSMKAPMSSAGRKEVREFSEDLAYALNRAHEERTDTACSYTEKMGSIYRKTYWDCTETGGSK